MLSSLPDAAKRRRSDRGQALVETAFILFLLLFLILSIFDFSVLFYVYLSLEQGISEATRYQVTGQQLPDPNKAGNFLSRDDSVKMTMRGWNPLITLNDSAFTFEHLNGTTWIAGSGGPNDISRVTVNYNWRLLTPLVSPIFTGGQAALRVSSTMKNEGYPSP